MNSATTLQTLSDSLNTHQDALLMAAALGGGCALVVVVGLGGGLIVLARAQGWLGVGRARRAATLGLIALLGCLTLPLVVTMSMLSATLWRAVEVVPPALANTTVEQEMGYLLLSPALAVAQVDPVVNQAARAGHNLEIPGRQGGNDARAVFPMAWLLDPTLQDRVFEQMTPERIFSMGRRGRQTLLDGLDAPLPRAWVGVVFEHIHQTLTKDNAIFVDLMTHLHPDAQGRLSYRDAANQASLRFFDKHLSAVVAALLIDVMLLTLLVAWLPFLLTFTLLVLALRPRLNERFPVYRPSVP